MYEHLRFPGGKSRAITMSFDDGCVQDVRLVEILRKTRLKATFNLNSGMYGEGRRMTHGSAVSLFRGGKHEIAVHGVRHRTLTYLDRESLIAEVAGDKRAHEEDFGGEVIGLAYPYGKQDERVIETLRECGIEYARAGGPSMSLSIPSDRMRWEPTLHYSNGRLFDMCEKLTAEGDDARLLYVWGHSYEFDDRNNWEIIEKFAREMGNRDDIYYATNGELHRYLRAYESLVFDGARIYNPTERVVYLSVDGREITLGAGETVAVRESD